MSDDIDWELIDRRRSCRLGDVGSPDYLAATVVSSDGTTSLVLARRDAVNDDNARYEAACSDVAHEQLGRLPIEFVRRLTVSRRKSRKERS